MPAFLEMIKKNIAKLFGSKKFLINALCYYSDRINGRFYNSHAESKLLRILVRKVAF